MRRAWLAALLSAALIGLGGQAAAQSKNDLIIEKRTFELPSLTTLGGKTLKNVRIGWQAAGTLNADKSNVVLVAHYFTGTSQAFGKFTPEGPAGYWDAIIGPGKAIDTDKYYVLSTDTLININVHDPRVVTTGPASINPDTGKPYGMSFPVIQFADMVNVQKALVDSLGIKHLHAVIGPSGGSLQAYEWAARYPEMVGKLIPVIGAAESDAYLISMLDLWAAPIRLDPNWNNGDYYGREPPAKGAALSLSLITFNAFHADFLNKQFGRQPADPTRDPAADLDNKFKVEQWLEGAGTARAKLVDANSILYLVKANQLFVAGGGLAEEGLKKIKAPTLLVPSPSDLVFLPGAIERTRAILSANGTPVEVAPLSGPNGHLNGILSVASAGDKIAAFLAK